MDHSDDHDHIMIEMVKTLISQIIMVLVIAMIMALIIGSIMIIVSEIRQHKKVLGERTSRKKAKTKLK